MSDRRAVQGSVDPKMGIIVLNYGDPDNTISLLRSSQQLLYGNYQIYVVDNGSSDADRGRLQSGVADYPRATVIPLPVNGGFSWGMNQGIRRATADGCTFLLLCNNDIEFKTSTLLRRIVDVWAAQPSTGIIGPRIVTPDGTDQNPIRWAPFSKQELRFLCWMHTTQTGRLWYWTRYYYLPKFLAVGDLWQRMSRLRHRADLRVKHNRHEMLSVYMLFGACFALTPSFLEQQPLLDEGTFFYGEENILASQCSRYDLSQVLLPEEVVLHKDAAATKARFGAATLRHRVALGHEAMAYWLRSYGSGVSVSRRGTESPPGGSVRRRSCS